MATLLKYKKGLKRPTLAWNECHSLHPPSQPTSSGAHKNRLKRPSFNHLSTHIATYLAETLPTVLKRESHLLMPMTGDAKRKTCSSPPKCTTKNSRHDTARKASTLEMLDRDYNTSAWTHVYIHGSSDAAVRNGGSLIHIRLGNGKTLSRSQDAGALTSNYRAELTVVHEA